ncbi:MarR family transcriptional regulator [Variovorax paradoxus]|uniref:DNA-binding MarR family transcriptional regulator n=1 Tax=Variovorax paradoxus TaxID=34073 RepID=A0AAW8EKS7_VARPD|nr:MarR family transcriptional regulator [Variovorax paradoxus]MBW8719131.1 MarR family transcriptional regulator [Variovorax paradoxus]MDP9973049.1 DNA-binding MarR family transcriptional regulator [Variovorax paradoxus]
MASNLDSADALQCAARLRTAVSQFSRQLRSGPAAPDGPSVAKLSVLGQLHRHGPCTPTALAAHERVKLQSLTRLLAELEAEGWIGRAPHATDGRQWLLSLTPEGLRRLKALMRSREAALARAIGATLGAEQRALLLQACGLLDRIAGALEEGGEPSTGAARPR